MTGKISLGKIKEEIMSISTTVTMNRSCLEQWSPLLFHCELRVPESLEAYPWCCRRKLQTQNNGLDFTREDNLWVKLRLLEIIADCYHNFKAVIYQLSVQELIGTASQEKIGHPAYICCDSGDIKEQYYNSITCSLELTKHYQYMSWLTKKEHMKPQHTSFSI